jgi:hypothetical protein
MRQRITKLAGTALVGAGLALGTAAGVASAQDVTPPTTERFDDDRGMDWGWIGLLGLAGLAGLMGREKRPAYRTATQTTTNPNRV